MILYTALLFIYSSKFCGILYYRVNMIFMTGFDWKALHIFWRHFHGFIIFDDDDDGDQ